MKRGRNLKKQECIYVASLRLNPTNWLISKKMSDAWVIVHRGSGKSRTIPAP